MTKGFDGIPHFEIKLWIMLNRASHTLCIVIELMHIEIPPNSTTNKLWNVGVVVMDAPTFGAWVFFCVCTLCVCLYVFFYKKMGGFSHIYKFQSLWHNSYGLREKVLGLLGSVIMFLLFKCVIKVWFFNIHSTNHLASLLPHLCPKHQISCIVSRKRLYIY